MAEKKQGKIVFAQRGLIRTYDCTCGAGCCDPDDGGVTCIIAPEYGLNGCGAYASWPEQKEWIIESKKFKHKVTGEIRTQIPILEMNEWEEERRWQKE